MDIQVVGAKEVKDPRGVAWPEDTILVVAKDSEGSIAGISGILQLAHIEGTWVRESERGTLLAYRLVKRVEQRLKEAGKSHAIAFVDVGQPEVRNYMARLGYSKMPLIVMSKEL